jgi:hypothetical protein
MIFKAVFFTGLEPAVEHFSVAELTYDDKNNNGENHNYKKCLDIFLKYEKHCKCIVKTTEIP